MGQEGVWHHALADAIKQGCGGKRRCGQRERRRGPPEPFQASKSGQRQIVHEEQRRHGHFARANGRLIRLISTHNRRQHGLFVRPCLIGDGVADTVLC